ncbi:MAG: beta-Ala-His dipeptidase, partial [Bacteroidales bacterium]|nr:beta-Ala-His dipeptidase [Bacteroidales bacterium]
MSDKLNDLEPKILWGIFDEMTQIPRPSKFEDKIQEWAVNFGNKLELETFKDDVGNVIIRKPATKGMEDKKAVVLQGHLDMVPQKNSSTQHDFKKDPIKTFIEGDWVKAKGTTLGSDNGIGAAAALAVISSDGLEHPDVEVLLTSDEETGMTGANGLKPGILKGDILINMDSEDEGELYIGCAGGVNTNTTFEYENVEVPANMAPYKISVTGLKGGHSGLDIHLGRGNANKIINHLMMEAAEKFGMRLAEIDGGNLRNAIPREAFATIVVPEG